jgi:superfamily II DNA or RNA helicase
MYDGFLNYLEEIEQQLLSWGVTDKGFSEDEIEKKAAAFLDLKGLSFDVQSGDLIQAMLGRHLLFRFAVPGGTIYRTRMAESVRLFARLRQLFELKGWRTAPTLVSDYRFMCRPRSFPARETPPNEAIGAIRAVVSLTEIQQCALNDLLGVETKNPTKLADFQVRATAAILKNLTERRTAGTIVGAGTGSGKTIAFYFPVFLHLAAIDDVSAWTRCLAIYPRKELLKDQFTQTYSQVRKLDRVLHANGRRKMSIGTYFSSTPYSSSIGNDGKLNDDWKQSGADHVCPFIKCGCGADLLWKKADREQAVERLVCSKNSCGCVVQSDEIVLTRQKLKQSPPDILFTTTEMLNQHLSDSGMNHVFGVNIEDDRKPRVVLLDEAHTYSGTHGAQVAMLLRRWQYASNNRKIVYVGLSATLKDAPAFFSDLTGLRPGVVSEISPEEKELEKKGMEYLLALRGDPLSKTALLSTTIQTSMLISRVLDPRNSGRSEKAYGSKVFVFGDDLDVVNRLFKSLRDAEQGGRQGSSLASLRASNLEDHTERFALGQSWDLCENIGHSLQPHYRKEIGRTSSQDPGVLESADILVATASLEVGFNDPTVGAVVQHKAPRSTAQFIQRKGRAGRSEIMRPWTIIVLSDYGRDRLAYQGYEQLFDPTITPDPLPIGNRYVLRMQATYAFMDWLGREVNTQQSQGSIWNDLKGPGNVERQSRIANSIREVLKDKQRQEELSRYIEKALGIDADTVKSLFWEQPRPLMTTVLPTALRRLESNWSHGGIEMQDPSRGKSPLPEFVPPSLFTDLLLPEVEISKMGPTPNRAQIQPQGQDLPRMPIASAMTEFAPGNVSHRFGLNRITERHWIVPDILTDQYLPMSKYSDTFGSLGWFDYEENNERHRIECFRPFDLKTSEPPATVRDTSIGSLDWKTQIIPKNEGWRLHLPQLAEWQGIISGIFLHTHNRHQPIEIRRFATQSNATILYRDGSESNSSFIFTRADVGDGIPERIGIGFQAYADALVVRYIVPKEFHLTGIRKDSEKVRILRTAYFKHCLHSNSELSARANVFQRGWLSQVYLSGIVLEAIQGNCSLQEAAQHLRNNAAQTPLTDILTIIFQVAEVDEDNDIRHRKQSLAQDISTLLNDQIVMQVLTSTASVLWEDLPNIPWTSWIERKFKVTLGVTIHETFQQLCPELDVRDLILDLDPGVRPDGNNALAEGMDEIWFTEETVGGGGVVEKILSKYASDPYLFFKLMEGALGPNDFEIMDEQLTRFLQLATTDDAIKHLVSNVRNADTHHGTEKAFDMLRRDLSSHGMTITRSLMSALNIRILRPGSSLLTDEMLSTVISRWNEYELRLGIEIDARVLASICSTDRRFDTVWAALRVDRANQNKCFNILYSLLWPRGSVVRGQQRTIYNRFAKQDTMEMDVPERDLLRDLIHEKVVVVDVSAEDWFDEVQTELSRVGIVTIKGEKEHQVNLSNAILRLCSVAVDVGGLLLHPHVRGVARTVSQTEIILSIEEVMQ